MDKTITTATSPIDAKLTIPGSKSITNRALLLAALADGVSELFDILISDDTRVFVTALHELGVSIMLDEGSRSCIVGGTTGSFPKKKCNLWCGDAGTAARFLLAACASTEGIFQLDGSNQLRNRPLESLIKVVSSQGAKIIPEDASQLPFAVLGREGLLGGEIEVDGSQTGQFVSALLMVAPFAKTPVLIKTENLVSEPYVEMTCAMMAEFGILVKRMHHARFYVPVPQRYHGKDYTIEPDLSTASYFFAAAAVTAGQVRIQAVDLKNSKQADAKFLTILEKMGCEVISSAEDLTVKGTKELQGVSVDMRDCSDTFMTLAAIAPFAKSATTITNIGHARKKESDRIQAMSTGLKDLGIKVESGEDWIKIYPGTPHAGTINCFEDHRIAMSFSIIGLKVPGIIISGAECVSKTCPDFFDMWFSMTVQS